LFDVRPISRQRKALKRSLAYDSPKVNILLSTYNGARFLQAQLESFSAQHYENWILHWRDDGSTDDSVSMIRSYAEGLPAGRCVESPSSGPHIGAAESFLTLLGECADADAIAFADQDDVWLPRKLQNAVQHIAESGDHPVLYCARQFLVDEALLGQRRSPLHEAAPGFPACLAQNIATGNTLVMNRAAAALVAGMTPPEHTVHDWWSYMVVSACGGRIIFDACPQVLYRLHPHNLIGSARSTPARAFGAVRRGPGIFMTMMRRHVDALAAHAAQLTPQARHELRIIQSALQGGVRARIAALRCNGFRRRTAIENLLFAYWFLTDRGLPAMLSAKDNGPRPHWATRERPAAE
jgi:glycosyltransferase involved in cell wall biosynthesis